MKDDKIVIYIAIFIVVLVISLIGLISYRVANILNKKNVVKNVKVKNKVAKFEDTSELIDKNIKSVKKLKNILFGSAFKDNPEKLKEKFDVFLFGFKQSKYDKNHFTDGSHIIYQTNKENLYIIVKIAPNQPFIQFKVTTNQNFIDYIKKIS